MKQKIKLKQTEIGKCYLSGVLEIFNELKNKNFINNKSKLISTEHILDFRATFFGKNIQYNPKILSKFSSDETRFILLHEMGHHNSFSWQTFAVICPLIIFIPIAIAIYSSFTFNCSSILYVFSLFILFTISFKLFRPLMKEDELNADEFAARKMIEVYHKRPSLIIREIFRKLKNKSKTNDFIRGTLILVRNWINCHPKPEERIKNIICIENEAKK